MKIKKIKSNQTEERETINMMPGIVEKIKPQLRETCRKNEFHTTHNEGKTNQPEKRDNQYIYLTDLFLSVRTKFDKSNIHSILPWMKRQAKGAKLSEKKLANNRINYRELILYPV